MGRDTCSPPRASTGSPTIGSRPSPASKSHKSFTGTRTTAHAPPHTHASHMFWMCRNNILRVLEAASDVGARQLKHFVLEQVVKDFAHLMRTQADQVRQLSKALLIDIMTTLALTMPPSSPSSHVSSSLALSPSASSSAPSSSSSSSAS